MSERVRFGAEPLSRLGDWVASHAPECAVFFLGATLRLTMLRGYHATWAFDWEEHWHYVEWLLQKGTFPLPEDLREAQHPPLFYLLVAALVRHGVSRQGALALPVVCGIVRLALIWLGLEWYLPERRWARTSTLALAAILPASVHADGMLWPEGLNGLLAAAVMLLIPMGFEAKGRRKWWLAAGTGVLLGIEMTTKISGLVLVLTVGLVACCELLPSGRDRRDRARAFAPWCAAITICVAIGGWYYYRNYVHYHNPFVQPFDLPTQWLETMEAFSHTAYLDRRTLGFVLGWDTSIYKFPYYVSDSLEHARFFSRALASTFVDFENHSFSGLTPSHHAKLMAVGRPLTEHLVLLSRGSVIGGTVILLPTLAATGSLLYRTFRTREWGIFCLLLIPIVTTVFALHYAIKYPRDDFGVIKGTYMQFGAPPMYAMFGVAVEWAFAQRRRWPVGIALLLGLGLVAAYTVCCRTGWLLGPVITQV